MRVLRSDAKHGLLQVERSLGILRWFAAQASKPNRLQKGKGREFNSRRGLYVSGFALELGDSMEQEEVILVGEYKDFISDRHYYVGNASAQDIAGILVQLSDLIEPFIYRFSGIETAKIDSVLNVGQGLASVCEFIRSFKRDMLLPAAQNKSTMLPIAESYFIGQLLKRAGVAFKPAAAASIRPQAEKPGDVIAFIGNCKGWFAVKKLSVDAKTHDWEVAGILSGINNTIVAKAFDFAGIKTDVRSMGRKSLGNLADALSAIEEKNPYVVCRTCENFGYKPYASPEMLAEEYPDIKPPRMKGRKPKS